MLIVTVDVALDTAPFATSVVPPAQGLAETKAGTAVQVLKSYLLLLGFDGSVNTTSTIVIGTGLPPEENEKTSDWL